MVIQNNALLVNNAQMIPVNGIQYPNMPFVQQPQQVYPYPINPQYPQPSQSPQVIVQQNQYMELQEVKPSNQEQDATPMTSS